MDLQSQQHRAQVLAGSQTVNETFTVTSTTADGESVNETVTVTVTGSEDAPVITGTNSGAVAEDGALTATGTLATSDADATDTPSFTAQTDTAGTYGTFSITTAGAWTYNLDNTAAQTLADGATFDETFSVTSTTADGESVNETITVTVTGSEDTPVITGANSGTVAEDGTVTTAELAYTSDNRTNAWYLNGESQALGPNAGAWTRTDTTTVLLPSTGSYQVVFDLSNSGTPTRGNPAGLLVEISGQDVTGDLLTSGNWEWAPYQSVQPIQGVFDFSSLSWSTVSTYGSNGVRPWGTRPSISSQAEWIWSDNNFNSNTDARIFLRANIQADPEDGSLTATGSLATLDTDATDTPAFISQTDTAGTYGTFSVNTAGAWTYDLDNTAAQVLAGSQTVSETFTVTSTTADGESVNETVTVTITGSEDAPVITGITSGAVAEDGTLTATGTLATTDADGADTPSFTAQTDTAGTYGAFSVTTAGAWTYSLNNTATQVLADGATVDETFTVTSTTADGESVNETVTVTVSGSEDAPVITGTTSGAVAEDGTLTATGSLATTDADATDTPAFTAQTNTAGTYGTFSLTTAGAWTYSLNNTAAQVLADGATIDETFTVTSTTADGESVSETVTVTVTGAEDAPVITGTTSGAVAEEGTLTATGSLATTDADATDTPAFTAQTDTAGTYGTFSVNTAGAWTYSLNNTAAQVLAESQTVSETFTVTSTTADGESVNETVTVTVTGSEDAPVITGTTSGAVAEDGTLTATGTLASTDADATDTPAFTAQTDTAGTYGTFSVNTAGAWTYSLNNTAAQVLAGSQTVSETFTVTSTTADGESVNETITVTVTGSEDAPIITGTTSGAVAEDGTLTATGSLATTDADATDTPAFTAQTNTSGTYGTFSVTTAGTWTYNLDNTAAQVIADGQVVTESFTVTSTTADGESVTEAVSINVTGANDVATITGTATASVVEDSGATPSGTLVVNDPDTTDTTSIANSTLTGLYGTLSLVNGTWTYNLDNANSTVDALDDGDSLTDAFSVTATDGSSTTVTITINGADDAPTLSGAVTSTVYEAGLPGATGTGDTTLTTSGTLIYDDVEGDTLTIRVGSTTVGTLDGSSTILGTVNGDYGVLTVRANATWSYTLTGNVDHDNDTTPFESFSFTVNDGNASSTAVPVQINITDDGVTVADATATMFNAGGESVTATLNSIGVDSTYSANLTSNVSGYNGTTVTFADSGLTSEGHAIYYYVDSANTDVLIAYTDTSGANAFANSGTQTKLFEINANPNNDEITFSVEAGLSGVVDVKNTMSLSALNGLTAADVIVLHDNGGTLTGQGFTSDSAWRSDSSASIYDDSIIKVTTTQDTGGGRVATSTDTTANGAQQEIIKLELLDAPAASANFTLGVTGTYTWTAYDKSGNALSSATSSSTTLNIADVGPISSIELAPASTASSLSVDVASSSVSTIDNNADAGTLTFGVTLQDSDGSSDTADFAVTLTRVAQPGLIAMLEDSTRTLNTADFGILTTDPATTSITIQTLEQVGSLQLNGANVTVGQTITKTQLDNGDLTFQPLPNGNGLGYDSFDFSLNTNAGTGTQSATISVDVIPVDDGSINTVEDSDLSNNQVELNAAAGTTVGITALGTDPDTEDTITYSLSDNASGQFTIDPNSGVITTAVTLTGAVRTENVTVVATSSDGSSVNVTLPIDILGAGDDVAVVHESALDAGSGQQEISFDATDETGQDISAGDGTRIATGNLLTNDGAGTAITTVNGVGADGGGNITVTSSYGTLVVKASDGTYTYTLNNAADHSSGDDAIEDTFSYVSDAGVNASLRVDIVDDSPISRDIVAESPEIEFDSFRLVFTLDLSGSMSLSQYDGLVYLDDGTVTTRLAMAKEALKALATEYFEQSNSVSIHLVTFTNSATTLNSGNAYTTLDSVLNGIDGITGSGSTNYEAALEETIDAFDSYGSSNGEKLISYFISDGEPTQGDTSDPVGAAGWDTYRNNNNVKSYAIGIGGIADTSALDSIHNIDALGSGSAHSAIIVEDPGILEDELLSTVPTAFVGSIMQTGAVQGVVLGADEGNIRSLTVSLDTDNNSATPNVSVTYTYNAGTNQISNTLNSNVLTGASIVTLTAADGFEPGSFIFDFSDGSYTFAQDPSLVQGDSFQVSYVVEDADGDISDSATLTLKIVDGKPIALDDADTLKALETELEGNVIDGLKIDGGILQRASMTEFTSASRVVDYAVDNARVSSITFRGVAFDLTTPVASTTAGTSPNSYTYAINSDEVLTLTHEDGTGLTFASSGYYLLTPTSVPNGNPGAEVRQDFESNSSSEITESASKGIIVSSPDGDISYDSRGGTRGLGVTGEDSSQLDSGERLRFDFDAATYPYGIQGFDLEASSLNANDYETFTITAFGIDGRELDSVAVVGTQWHNDLFPKFSSIGAVEVQMGSAGSALVRAIRFHPVGLDTSATAIAPEEIGYTLTDDNNDQSSATLSLRVISNQLADIDGDNIEDGTAANDLISGLDGNDDIEGAGGHDVLDGGAGDDLLYGQADNDSLFGGSGDDTLWGGTGDDILEGGDNNDILYGEDGEDELRGGAGDDNLYGGTESDTLEGGSGDDRLEAGAGNDSLMGGIGEDTLMGDAGVDFIMGGAGSDKLTGGSGADVFAWGKADYGNSTNPYQDEITDFSATDGDVIDLSDLLVDEENGNLSDYIRISTGNLDGNGATDTEISIDHDGGNFHQPTNKIQLTDVDLSEGGTLSEQEMLNKLLNDGNLDVDT